MIVKHLAGQHDQKKHAHTRPVSISENSGDANSLADRLGIHFNSADILKVVGDVQGTMGSRYERNPFSVVNKLIDKGMDTSWLQGNKELCLSLLGTGVVTVLCSKINFNKSATEELARIKIVESVRKSVDRLPEDLEKVITPRTLVHLYSGLPSGDHGVIEDQISQYYRSAGSLTSLEHNMERVKACYLGAKNQATALVTVASLHKKVLSTTAGIHNWLVDTTRNQYYLDDSEGDLSLSTTDPYTHTRISPDFRLAEIVCDGEISDKDKKFFKSLTVPAGTTMPVLLTVKHDIHTSVSDKAKEPNYFLSFSTKRSLADQFKKFLDGAAQKLSEQGFPTSVLPAETVELISDPNNRLESRLNLRRHIRNKLDDLGYNLASRSSLIPYSLAAHLPMDEYLPGSKLGVAILKGEYMIKLPEAPPEQKHLPSRLKILR